MENEEAQCGDGGTSADGGGSSTEAPAGVFELPELAGPLGDVVPGELSFDGAARALAAAAKLSAWAEGLKARLVARLGETSAGTVPQPDPAGPSRYAGNLARMNVEAEISGALTIPEQTAQRLIFESGELVTTFSNTLEALESGALNREQAMAIVDQGQTVPKEAQPEFEQELLAAAGRARLPRPKLAARARRLRERMHPETITRRRAKAACDRRIYLQPAEDGMAWLGAYLPAEAATAAYNRVTTAARELQCPDEARTLTQLRADVLTDLLLAAGLHSDTENLKGGGSDYRGGGTICGPGDTANAGSAAHDAVVAHDDAAGTAGAVSEPAMPHYDQIRPEVHVTVPVLTLLGHSEEPAELEGYGPIDGDTARRLAANAPSFKRILTHPETGAMISYGKTTYKVPADLKRMINIRDRCCRAPGCNRAAMFCELDHLQNWHPYGNTEYFNLQCLCKKHHALKHACGWTPERGEGATIHWTSPAGLTYTTEPEGPVLTSRKDARRHNTGSGHRFDPWDPENPDDTPPPPPSGTEEPPPF